MTDEKDAIPPSFRTGGAIDALAGIAAEDNLPGRELGDYRLVGLLAEGGMSRVYRAERIDGSFEREVAIKVSYISGFDEQSRQRFLAEQSILAGFSHPHISQLFDAGLTEEGWPYFVMELVSGQPIVDYCADRTLDVSERVKLLTKVVEAVSYAHGQLVLHRDIKPSNVLVSDDGVPKLLDFGIAKPLDASTVIATQGAMTPRYASPEQILGEPTGVASDVYQLGLLISETLTGHSLNAEDDPLSLRRNLTAGTSVRLPAETRQQLPADCVAIIEQCLRLSADDRYPSAAALAEDLSAFLQGFPVRAVGQSVRYRAGKYVARNPGVVVFTVAVLLLLAGASTWYVYQVTEQRNIALQQQEMTEETLKFMASFFEASDPDKHQGQELTASEILIRGAERVERELGDRPPIQRRLFAEIATSFMGQERTNEAETYIRKAIALGEGMEIDETDPMDDFYIHQNMLATILAQKGELQEAWELQSKIYRLASSGLGPTHRRTLRAQANLGITARGLGRLDESLELLEDVYAKNLQHYGSGDRSTLISALSLIASRSISGQLAEAHELALKSVADAEAALGPQNPVTVRLMGNLSTTTLDIEGPAAAIPIKETMLERAAELYGKDNFVYLGHLSHLGAMLGRNNELERSEQVQIEAIAGMTALRGANSHQVLVSRSNLASTWVDMQQYDKALAELDDLTEMFTALGGADDPNVMFCRSMYLKILVDTKSDEAASYAQTYYDDLVRVFGEQDSRAVEVRSLLDQLTTQES